MFIVVFAQVWCCALSNDRQLAVSGSRDGTIRLWRVRDGMAAAAVVDAGADVFRVALSGDRRTVVALADRHGARRLLMLRVTMQGASRTTISSDESRCTAPPPHLLSTLSHTSTSVFSAASSAV